MLWWSGREALITLICMQLIFNHAIFTCSLIICMPSGNYLFRALLDFVSFFKTLSSPCMYIYFDHILPLHDFPPKTSILPP